MAGLGAHLLSLLREELRHFFTVQRSDRRWQMPMAAALASGAPLLVGAAFDHLPYGLIGSLGGLVFLYLPATPLYHRMAWLMACAFGMGASYTLGVLSQFYLPVLVPVLALLAMLVSMVCRFYAVGPPAALFFVMAAAIGAYSQAQGLLVPLQVGLFFMGTLLAFLIAFVYSLYVLRLQPPQPVPPLPAPSFDDVVLDSVVIGAAVGLSLALAQLLQLSRPYWVPVSCLAVIQGVSLRAMWNRQLQRIAGTALGLGVFWLLLLAVPLTPWTIAWLVIALTFVIETLVVRHYGLAAIFITPLTILLAEASDLGGADLGAVMQARLLDTVLGCVVGFAGGLALHSPRLRAFLGRQLRRLAPPRLGG